QVQGLMVESDDDTLLRAEFHRVGTTTRVFVATIDDAVPTTRASIALSLQAPMSIRVTRSGDSWRVEYSFDAESWLTAAAFDWVTTVTAVGPYAGNSAGTPFTARVESFTSGADPLPDTTPPLQSEIRLAAADDTVVVRWRTDEPAIG